MTRECELLREHGLARLAARANFAPRRWPELRSSVIAGDGDMCGMN
jgi:hypothetical protein